MSPVKHADLYGRRAGKYAALAAGDVASSDWEAVAPRPPFYLFTPADEGLREEYERGVSLPEIAPVNSVGVVTARDELTIDFDRDRLWARVRDFASLHEEEARGKYNLGKDARDWKVILAQEDLKRSGPDKSKVVAVLYRPFDPRFTYYTGVSRGFICMPRPNVMRHMLVGENLAFHTCRQIVSETWLHILFTNHLTDDCYVSNKTRERGYTFPLYLYDRAGRTGIPACPNGQTGTSDQRTPNLAPAFVAPFLARAVGATALVNSPTVGMRAPVGAHSCAPLHPEDIFYYIYAVLHAPTYRSRYAEFLKIDFPRIPLPMDYESFDRLASAGEKLARLHLLKDKESWDWRGVGQCGKATDTTVGKVDYDDANQEIIFDAKKPRAEQLRVGPVPAHIWAFHIGGYQVLQKWLKDRKGRPVALGDYVPIIIALMETDRIMKEECDPAFKNMLGL